jgi:hypothetical protein
MLERWHYIHEFFNGFGFKHEDKYVWCSDVFELLGEDKAKWDTDDDLDKLYEELRGPLAIRAEKISKWYKEHPFKIPEKLYIPNVKKEYPKLLISDVVQVQPMVDQTYKI